MISQVDGVSERVEYALEAMIMVVMVVVARFVFAILLYMLGGCIRGRLCNICFCKTKRFQYNPLLRDDCILSGRSQSVKRTGVTNSLDLAVYSVVLS